MLITEINSITVVAGLNNSGKSTIGKVLFSIFNGLNNIEKRTSEYIFRSIYNLLGIPRDVAIALGYKRAESTVRNVAQKLLELENNFTKEMVLDIVNKQLRNNSSSNYNIDIEQIYGLLKLSKNDINKRIVQNLFLAEFQGQIQNVDKVDDSSINLKIKNHSVNLKWKDNAIVELLSPINLTHEAVYVDDILVLDRLAHFELFRDVPHRKSLKRKIMGNKFEESNDAITEKSINELMIEGKLKDIFEELNRIVPGTLEVSDLENTCYKNGENKKDISIFNLSTGLKIFVIIKTLLLNGFLEKNGTLILDEPEVHLHPEWQILLAKIIVLLQKEFKMHILISSHSHYFVNAIEVYSKKYEISTPKFYLTREDSNGNIDIDDVSCNLEPIYNLFYRPLLNLEEEEFKIS